MDQPPKGLRCLRCGHSHFESRKIYSVTESAFNNFLDAFTAIPTGDEKQTYVAVVCNWCSHVELFADADKLKQYVAELTGQKGPWD